MLKLISDADRYELVWEQSDQPRDSWAVFTLRKLTSGQVNAIEDQLTAMGSDKGDRKLYFMAGTSRRLKIRYTLVEWKNIKLDGDKDAPCTDDNKEKLPAEVQTWLEESINEKNGLMGVPKETRKN